HAAQVGCSGVVCGHIHTPKISELNGIAYYNTGDWVESCTALVEYSDGSFELLYRPLNLSAEDSGRPEAEAPLQLDPAGDWRRPLVPVLQPIAAESSLLEDGQPYAVAQQ